MIARQEIAGDSRAFLAAWRKRDRRDRYVPAKTMCWYTRLPWFLVARRPGFETKLSCRDCPGCREFEALRLARRLAKTYRDRAAAEASSPSGLCLLSISNKVSPPPRLFEVRIYCPKELHAALNRKMHRWLNVEIEPGFFRAGVESFNVLSSSPSELVERLRRRKFRLGVRPLGRLDRARSWRHVARGLIVARDVYGENINRFYCLGLAPADKETFKVENIDEYKHFDRGSDPRATSEELGDLVPAQVFKLQRGLRLRMRNTFRRATSPEAVDSIMPDVLALVRRVADQRTMRFTPAYQENPAEAEALLNELRERNSLRADLTESRIFIPQPEGVRVTQVLDNSGSFEERRKRLAEAMMRAPPAESAAEEEAWRLWKAGEQERTARSDRNSKHKLEEAKARLRELVARRERKEKDRDG